MSDKIKVNRGDGFWSIANRCGILGDGSGWKELRVQRGDKLYSAESIQNGSGLIEGDTVVLPENKDHNCQDEIIDSVQAATDTQQLSSTQGKKISEASEKASSSPISSVKECSKEAVIVLDPGHGGKSYKDNINSNGKSSWNNAICCVTDTLEKSMTQKVCDKIKEWMDSDSFVNYGKQKGFDKIDTILTKNSEDINISGKDRAGVAKNNKADIYFIIHFNSYDDESLLSIENKRKSWEQVHVLDITKGVDGVKRDKPSGFTRRYYSAQSVKRGSQLLYNSSMPSDIQDKSVLISKDIKSKLENLITSSDVNAHMSKNEKIVANYGAMSPKYLGVKNDVAKKIIPVYLEADYINVESADNLWNNSIYDEKIESFREKEMGLKKNEKGSFDLFYENKDRLLLGDFYNYASFIIAMALIDNLKNRIC